MMRNASSSIQRQHVVDSTLLRSVVTQVTVRCALELSVRHLHMQAPIQGTFVCAGIMGPVAT